MTYNPTDLLNVRRELGPRLGLGPADLGIAGDSAHASSGGYHEGNDDLNRAGRLDSDYSKRESARDRPGSNAASAFDLGKFARLANGLTLPALSVALVAACRRGDPRTRDIREVIYSPDGKTVMRWDRLGIRSTGDSSHLVHTHLSFFRDSEDRRDRQDNVFGLLVELIEGDDMALTDKVINTGGRDLDTVISDLWNQVARGESGFVPGARQWMAATLAQTLAAVQAIAAKVDVGPEELAAIQAAAKAGAASAADDIVTRVLAGLPPGTLTAADVEQALRHALAGGLVLGS